jgi:hypothetical protein
MWKYILGLVLFINCSGCAGPKYLKKRNFSNLNIGDRYSATKELHTPNHIEKILSGKNSGTNVFIYEWDLPKDDIINRMYTYIYVKNDIVTGIYEDPADKYIKNQTLAQAALRDSDAELNYYRQIRAENARRFAMAMAAGMQGVAYQQQNFDFMQPQVITPVYTPATGNTTRIKPDFMGGYRATDSSGNTSRIKPDFMGGYRATDSSGNTTRIKPDFMGGYRATDSSGNTTRIKPDFMGGYRATDSSGNTTRIKPY